VWLRHPLDDILSSRAKVALLRVLMRAPGPLNGREVARRAGVNAGHASRQLRELALSGVVRARDQGRVITYEIGADASGVVASLRALFAAEGARYRDAIADLARRLPEAVSLVLFGSEARLDAAPGSDTDLLVIVPEHTPAAEARVREACLAVADNYSLALSWVVMDLAELREAAETGSELWGNVRREGARLHGRSLEALEREWQRGATTSPRPSASAKPRKRSTTRNT
jgi:predicted nucleotidyltransferase